MWFTNYKAEQDGLISAISFPKEEYWGLTPEGKFFAEYGGIDIRQLLADKRFTADCFDNPHSPEEINSIKFEEIWLDILETLSECT